MPAAAAVHVTNPEKLLWPEAGVRKIDYLHYLTAVSHAILPHLWQRPVTFIRYPHGVPGVFFYQKNSPAGAPDWLSIHVDNSGAKPIRHVLVNDLDTLLWAGNQACLEIHPWYSRIGRPDHPTHLALDIDPMTEEFEDAREAAFIMRSALMRLNLTGYPKTSGKGGIQIYVPITPRYTFADTRIVLQFLAQYVSAAHPDKITTLRSVRARGSRVYLDYLQHAPRKTLVAPYSPRGTPLATVSAPVTWAELDDGVRPEDFTVRTMPQRLAQAGDLFAHMNGSFSRTGDLRMAGDSEGNLDPILDFLHQRHP